MTISKHDVTFRSGDSFAAGWFFLPEDAASGAAVPAVAMAHGIGAVEEMGSSDCRCWPIIQIADSTVQRASSGTWARLPVVRRDWTPITTCEVP
jgi:hypothetical protein